MIAGHNALDGFRSGERVVDRSCTRPGFRRDRPDVHGVRCRIRSSRGSASRRSGYALGQVYRWASAAAMPLSVRGLASR